MQIFEDLLSNSRKEYAAGKFANALAILNAASKYLKALVDAEKQINPQYVEPKQPGP